MNGKLVGIFFAATALIGGVAVYALNVYAFYEDATVDDIRLMSLTSEAPEPIFAQAIQAIDATSSPLRFRACFTTDLSQATLTETYVIYDEPVPLTGPGWFDCYNAQDIGAALESAKAIAFLSEKEIRPGVDRVVAIFDDGHGFAWHQLNETFDE